MNSVNLIPAYRLHARRIRTRRRIWGIIGTGWLSALAIAHIWLSATWSDDSPALAAQIESADAEIKQLEAKMNASRAALAEAQATLRARRAVQDQPDWGLLLVSLASRLDQRAVLSGCSLEPAGDGGRARSREAARTQIRPGHYTLDLTGLARTQDTATAIAIALEATGIFERVSLLEARRAGFLGEDAVRFRLQCALADPAAEVQ